MDFKDSRPCSDLCVDLGGQMLPFQLLTSTWHGKF
uniref:Uncharacterized protein n=1 Tax=Anguilla anguilla TaxID=7936 RepID=A0A0E9TU65_ANGAN